MIKLTIKNASFNKKALRLSSEGFTFRQLLNTKPERFYG